MKKFDVVILGGGISGSLFALNLTNSNKNLSILILDKKIKSKLKVGEATADLSSIFLNRLGINHLLKEQTKKTGLRFIFNEKNSSKKTTKNICFLICVVFPSAPWSKSTARARS